jgi:predicted flap endonuclease-1-like 5' DNA nuclease
VAGGQASAAALDPAPFRESIDGVGEKIEPQLFRAGIRTYDALARLDYGAFRAVLSPRTPMARELFDSIQRQAREIAAGTRTWPPGVLATWARDANRRLEQLPVEGGAA